MALLAGVAPSHVELAGVKQWWGTDVSEISVDVASSSWQDNVRQHQLVGGSLYEAKST